MNDNRLQAAQAPMCEPDPLLRTLCCGATCGRGSAAQGPCVAHTYGRAILDRIETAGYIVGQQESLIRLTLHAAADTWARGLSVTIGRREYPIGHLIGDALRSAKIIINDDASPRRS